MLGLIWFNLRYKNTKISEKHFNKIITKINRSTIGYKLIAFTALIVAATISVNEVYGWFTVEDKDLEKLVLAITGGVFAITSYVVFFARKTKITAMNLLIKRSTELIGATLEEENLASKSVIISNLANGKELGFTSDSAIVGIIPKRNELSVFEFFVEFVKIDNKLYPIFKNAKSNIIKIDNKDLLSISEYFERGNYVPKGVKQGIATLLDNKATLVKHGMDIEEVVEPQENTIIELKTVNHRIAFRAYKFKEILAGVYTDIKTKQDYTAIMQDNAELKKQVARYKSKLMEM